MKLTDFLDNVGRPIAYYPKMKKLTGSTTATVLLCQFIYWRGKEADPKGWLKKTSDEIEEETGLTYNEQKTARKDLVSAGLLKEHYARLDHEMKFLLDLEAINKKWGELFPETPQSDHSTFGNDGSPLSLNSNTENTTENITVSENKQPKTDADVFTFFEKKKLESRVHNGENDEALKAFERDMKVSGSWSWYPAKTSEESTWRKFRKAVCRIYEEDSQGFSKYNTWRMQPYVKGAMTNLGIRRNPELFEESYVGFLAQTGATGSPNVTEYKPRGISA